MAKLRRFVRRGAAPLLLLLVVLLGALTYQIPRALRINVGSAQDRGFTQGFFVPERNAGFAFRWSREESEVSLPSLAGGMYDLSIGASAPRPDGSTAHVELSLDERALGSFDVGPEYQRFSFTVSIPPGATGNHTLMMRTQTVKDAKNGDRKIGIAVDDVALRAASFPLAPPLVPMVALLADAALFYWLVGRWRRDAAFIATMAGVVAGLLYFLALRHPLGPAVYQLFIPLAFVSTMTICTVWAIRRAAPPAWALAAAGALSFAILSAADFAVRMSQVGNPTDFRIFYRAATAVWTGRPQEIYDLAATRADPLLGVVFRQPPLVATMIAPLSALSFPAALLMWRLMLIGFVILALWLLTRHLGLQRIGTPEGWPMIALVFLTLLWAPLRVSVTSGQWDPILLLLLVVAFIALRRKWSPLAGFAIALAGVIKIYPLYLALFLLWKREWRALGWLIGSLAALTLVCGLTTGWDTLRVYARDIFPLIGGSTTFAQNQSLAALPLRLFGIEATQGLGITALTLACFAAVTGALCWRLRDRTERESGAYALGYGLTIGAMLLVVPVAWDHYETVLLIPVAVLLVAVASTTSFSPPWLTITVVALGLLTYGESRALPSALASEAFQYDDLTRAILASSRVFGQLGLMFSLWQLARTGIPHIATLRSNDAVLASPQETDAAM